MIKKKGLIEYLLNGGHFYLFNITREPT